LKLQAWMLTSFCSFSERGQPLSTTYTLRLIDPHKVH